MCMLLLPVTQFHFNMHMLLHDPSVCVFMYGQATESRWVVFGNILLYLSESTCKYL